MPDYEQKPSICRMVVYRSLAGFDRPAVILATPESVVPEPPAEGHVHLEVFWGGVGRDYIDSAGVPFSDSPASGFWSWPERV